MSPADDPPDTIATPKESKSKNYKAAFAEYMTADVAPDILKLADKHGCHGLSLVNMAENAHWAAHRVKLKAGEQMTKRESRLELAERVDAEILNRMASEITKAGECYTELLEKIRQLPTEGKSDDAKRGKSAQTLLRVKTELLSDCIKGLMSMSSEARSLGLVVPLKASKEPNGAGGLDLSKIATLNVTLVQAQQAAGVKPDPVDVSRLQVAPAAEAGPLDLD